MDRLKQKLKKEKQVKDSGKDKQSLFITDVKSIKENLKIKEILRSVKMNSSMRLKGPPGSKIMNSKDFNEEDCFEESSNNQNSIEPLSAFNPDVDVTKADLENQVEREVNSSENELSPEVLNINKIEISEASDDTPNEAQSEKNNSLNNTQSDIDDNDEIANLTASLSNGKLIEKNRDRKLSLDHTMLSRQDGFSQSELDLHTIGKSPLERKYSFFRKKMDSFVRNTTEMFRRQNSFLQRRGSMSVSLQSLNDKCNSSETSETKCPPPQDQEPHGSRTSLQIPPSPIVRSTSSLSLMQSGNLPSSSSQNSLAGSQPALHGLNRADSEELHSNSHSVHSLNEFYLKEAMLKSRAISMSSGLDAPFRQQSRKASRSNRSTWIASECLANSTLRKIQDEHNEMQTCHSYQDFSSIPENELYSQIPDNKGRRLSYQRAVSGEDPMPMQLKYQDSTLRKKHQFPESYESRYELANILAEYTKHGVPTLRGFDITPVPEEAYAYLLWATKEENYEEFFNWKTLPDKEQSRQAVIKEFIFTEAEYMKHLMTLIEVYIGAAHGVQNRGKMLNIETAKLFSNLPDVLNASLSFWHLAYVPMLADAIQNSRPFNMQFMSNGFSLFREIFVPYEKFVVEQGKLLEYYRKKQQTEADFAMFLTWCHSHKECNRLQLNDYLVKPMQRMTKYSLILERILNHTDDADEYMAIKVMVKLAKNILVDLNRSVRQRDELDQLDLLENSIEGFTIGMKDDDVEKICKSLGKLNVKAPMLYCLPIHKRNLIHQGELRFRDGAKEIDVRVLLLTDMLLVCRKLARGKAYQYKQIRPKYMIDKLVQIPKFVGKNNKNISCLLYVLVDDLGSPCTSFCLSEMPKDPKPQRTLKTWELKFKEAKLTYELVTLMSKNPDREIDKAAVSRFVGLTNIRSSKEDKIVETEARERVATMIHRSIGAPNDRNFLPTSWNIQTFDGIPYADNQILMGASIRQTGRHRKCSVVHRTSIIRHTADASSQVSQPVSYQLPTSSQSHDELQSGPKRVVKRISISPDRLLPPLPDTAGGSSITVRVTESESEIARLQTTTSMQLSPSKSSECSVSTQSTLRVQPQNNVATLIYSLPDLTIEPSTPRTTSSPTQPTASERMYQSHHEVLERNRLMTTQTQQYLTPDSRGSSYPPPSPTRGSLKRSLAFSYSFKNPPLSKMGHVSSQSQLDTIQYSQSQEERGSSPKPGTSEKSDKKSKLSSSSLFSSAHSSGRGDGIQKGMDDRKRAL
ncbi:uncharacterized protein LOC125075888 isoform X2 [Vanessa atalanta]|uniref:uncharacterized protein LOC125075888 isoform X2 n=1 Tax=Vanessa atalanta TaxID=42275 RepID=UPI001FCDF5BE|nr:uncharacterized protein LOC125075888 isoform X2 [Vanessa atalanta]